MTTTQITNHELSQTSDQHESSVELPDIQAQLSPEEEKIIRRLRRPGLANRVVLGLLSTTLYWGGNW
jgi:hypothetical protein